jgi:pimeloyl-ACP methyl ester carboxylesterase
MSMEKDRNCLAAHCRLFFAMGSLKRGYRLAFFLCGSVILSPNLSLAWFFSTTSVSSPDKRASNSPQPPTIPPNVRLLILPGFGNDAQDYLRPGSLVESLAKRGWSTISGQERNATDSSSSTTATTAADTSQVRVLPIARSDWLQVFWRGCFDVQFWQNTADPTRPAFSWYLNAVATELEHLTHNDTTTRVVLIGHSAGGWLGRAALGYYGTTAARTATAATAEATAVTATCLPSIDLTKVMGLVTLGAPNLPPPPNVMDMTRGALRLTHETFPGAYHADELFYISVVGDAVQGVRQVRNNNPWERTSVTGFAYNSYQAVCGNGTTIGDGTYVCRCTRETCMGHATNMKDQWYPFSAHCCLATEMEQVSCQSVLRTWTERYNST